MSRLKLGFVLALLAGPFILLMNLQETNARKHIDREGIETAAIPTTKMERRGRGGGSTYNLEVRFPVKKETIQTATVEVSRDLYERVDVEPIVLVKYLKEDSSKVLVVGEPLDKPEMNLLGMGVLAIGTFGTWWHFGRRKPAAVPPPLHEG